jgi:hypothetical protein
MITLLRLSTRSEGDSSMRIGYISSKRKRRGRRRMKDEE